LAVLDNIVEGPVFILDNIAMNAFGPKPISHGKAELGTLTVVVHASHGLRVGRVRVLPLDY
jgi:hypothetical protein